MAVSPYTVASFVEDAKRILAGGDSLADQQGAIGERLVELSKRDDLTRLAFPTGPSDVSTGAYVLWREPPAIALMIGEFASGYMSPVHEHGDFWVVACGYRGEDRWDIYERLDDGQREGHSDVRLVDQWSVPPGEVVVMPPPPRAVHSHNGVAPESTLELIFSAVPPNPPEERLVHDVESGRCWPSGFEVEGVMGGDRYPPLVAIETAEASAGAGALRERFRGLSTSAWQARRPACACAF